MFVKRLEKFPIIKWTSARFFLFFDNVFICDLKKNKVAKFGFRTASG